MGWGDVGRRNSKGTNCPSSRRSRAASPQNLPACFFWDGCAPWRATKWEGVQNTWDLGDTDSSPHPIIFAQLQGPSSLICTTGEMARALIPQPALLEPLVALAWQHLGVPCLSRSPALWECLKIDEFAPISLESPDFYAWEFSAPFQRVKVWAEFGAGGEWGWRSNIIIKVQRHQGALQPCSFPTTHTNTLQKLSARVLIALNK